MPVVAAPRTDLLTPDEYFDWEERQDERHEYANGEVYTMPGGTYEHFLIIGNWVRVLGNLFADRPDLTALPDGMRLQIRDDRYVYPDVSVVAGPPAFREGSRRRVLLNPTAVVEVLSESTAAYDQGEKFSLYRGVESLQEIVWVDSERRRVEVARFEAEGWTLPRPIDGGTLALRSVGVEVSVGDLYAGAEGLG